jgi:hypothetical protein
MANATPRHLFFGQLLREYIILPSGEALIDVPGGNVLYAAVGLEVWETDPSPAIVARVGEDYPQEWLEEYKNQGLDIRGVHVLPQALDVRSFVAYASQTIRYYDDPVSHFARLDLPFPKGLLGYRTPSSPIDSRTTILPTSIRQADIPPDFLDASAAHLCPMDYLTHSLLPAVLRQAEFTTVTLEPSPRYMNPTFWGDVPALVTGLTAFLPSEEDLRSLFQGRSDDLWEMAEAIASYGCEIVVIKRGERGQWIYDSASGLRWDITAYPARVYDPSGAGDAFCGGFLAGYRRSYDPLEAALFGNISASLVVEGVGPFYALDALPGLAEARLDTLRQSVRKV